MKWPIDVQDTCEQKRALNGAPSYDTDFEQLMTGYDIWSTFTMRHEHHEQKHKTHFQLGVGEQEHGLYSEPESGKHRRAGEGTNVSSKHQKCVTIIWQLRVGEQRTPKNIQDMSAYNSVVEEESTPLGNMVRHLVLFIDLQYQGRSSFSMASVVTSRISTVPKYSALREGRWEHTLLHYERFSREFKV